MSINHSETWFGRHFETVWGPIRPYATRRMRWMLAIVGTALLLIFGYIKLSPLVAYLMMPKGAFIQIQSVSTVHAQHLVWQDELRSVGTLHAVEGADLASEIAGLVTYIGFRPGEDVHKGTLLVQLRDDSDRAQLAALQAAATLATQTYTRDAALIKSAAISQTEYDSALANMKGAHAQADSQAAIVEKKAIRAPYDGRVGIRQVDVGQYVSAGQVIVTLQQLDPILVDFQVPQQQLSMLSVGSKVALTSDAAPGKTFAGEVIAFDPKVDPDTRTVHVRASVANPEKKLLPGMFATVMTNVGQAKTLLTLPQTAVVYNPYGDTVYVVAKTKPADGGDEELTAQQRFVTVGETRGDQVAILSGVTAKDVVVSAGQLKLKNGTLVKVNNSVSLPNDVAPAPIDQ